MARVSGEILINRPVEQVFDYAADQRNEPIYNPRMLRSEKVTDGPIGVGTPGLHRRQVGQRFDRRAPRLQQHEQAFAHRRLVFDDDDVPAFERQAEVRGARRRWW